MTKSKAGVRDEADERSAPSAHVVYEAIRLEGEQELERRVSSLAWSGFAAGLSMGFSFLGEGLLHHYLPTAAWTALVSKLGYSIGFLIVILGRQQLFTENTLTVILPLLAKKTLHVLFCVARLWSIVLVANLAGALVFAFVIAKTNVVEADVARSLQELARTAVAESFGITLLRGVFAGWLIALMVWLLPAAESARVGIIIIITYLVDLAHFPHIIAGSGEAFYLAACGLRSWSDVIFTFALPALIGNTLGGVALVAALAHAQIVGDKEKESSGT
ncbi:MAG: formate/nitrite transporter family protein [Chthoniobacterales bacterium]